MTLREMRSRMSSHEFASWLAYDQIRPIGGLALDAMLAQLTAWVVSGATGKRAAYARFDLFSESRFTGPRPGRPIRAQQREAIRITRMLGGIIVPRKPKRLR